MFLRVGHVFASKPKASATTQTSRGEAWPSQRRNWVLMLGMGGRIKGTRVYEARRYPERERGRNIVRPVSFNILGARSPDNSRTLLENATRG